MVSRQPFYNRYNYGQSRWLEAHSTRHARILSEKLLKSIKRLEDDLVKRSIVDPATGKVVPQDEYEEWRRRATKALARHRSNYRELIAFIKKGS